MMKMGKIARVLAAILYVTVIFPAAAFAQVAVCPVTVPPVNPSPYSLATPCTCNDLSITTLGITNVLNCCQNLPSSFFYWADNCTESMINASANSAIGSVINGFTTTVVMVLTIAIVLFGYKLVTGEVGERQVKKEFAILLFKSITVLSILVLPPTTGTNFAVTIVQAVASLNSTLSSIIIPAVTGTPTSSVWLVVDQTLLSLLGMAGSFTGVVTIMSFVLLLAFTGALGVTLMMVMLMTVIVVIYALSLAFYIQISALIALAFLAMFTPLFLPMILFKHSGIRGLFDKWFNLLINYSIQPVMLVAYLSLMIAVMNAFANNIYSLFNPNPPPPTCTAFSVFGILKVSIPCINWSNAISFLFSLGVQVLAAMILAVSMVQFLRHTLPDITARLAGSMLGATTPWSEGQEMLNKGYDKGMEYAQSGGGSGEMGGKGGGGDATKGGGAEGATENAGKEVARGAGDAIKGAAGAG